MDVADAPHRVPRAASDEGRRGTLAPPVGEPAARSAVPAHSPAAPALSLGDAAAPSAMAGAVPRAAALAQLRELWEALRQAPQGAVPALAAEVRRAAEDRFLRHAERDVRLWSARCLAEGLRIFAPEPPLNGDRLRVALETFIEQLGALSESGAGALFVQTVGLLERLAEVQAFMLIFDCTEPEALLTSLTEACINGARGHSAGNVHRLLADVLASALGEADEPPKPALALLLRELAANAQAAAAAGSFLRRVLGGLASRSAVRFVNDFVVSALCAHPTAAEAGGVETGADVGPCELRAAIFALFVIEPGFVAQVLPNLQLQLRCDCAERRAALTTLVGRMLSHQEPEDDGAAVRRPGLFETHPLLLDRFLERLDDAEDLVRLAAVGGAGKLLEAAARAGGHLVGSGGAPDAVAPAAAVALAGAATRCRAGLAERSLDASMAVRLRVVEIAAELASSAAGFELLAPALPEILRRILDKRPLIREACIEALASLYKEHVLPAWVAGRYETARRFAWMPQLLCEAFAVFTGGRLGHTAQLEESIEQCFLGCDDSLEPHQRALALLGFCSSALQEENAAKGLTRLLCRKRDANVALRRFVQLRAEKAAPLALGDGGPQLGLLALHRPGGGGGAGAAARAAALPGPPGQATGALETLAEVLAGLSPAAEERLGGQRQAAAAAAAQLRALDAVRDRTLWALLEQLLGQPGRPGGEASAPLAPAVDELSRLLRLHHLVELAPLLRRSLLCTWLLPEQAPALLELWRGRGPEGAAVPPFLSDAARLVVAELPRYFPDAFARHIEVLVGQLSHLAAVDVRAALRASAALGKRRREAGRGTAEAAAPAVCRKRLTELLLRVPGMVTSGLLTDGSVYRKAIAALGLLPPQEAAHAVSGVLQWAQEQLGEQGGGAAGAALQFAAACLAQRTRDGATELAGGEGFNDWVAKAREALLQPPGGDEEATSSPRRSSSRASRPGSAPRSRRITKPTRPACSSTPCRSFASVQRAALDRWTACASA